ncbi:MAG: PASTA domain-containing protein [Brevinema sp.]
MKKYVQNIKESIRNFKWSKENIFAHLKSIWAKIKAFVQKYGNIQTWKDSMIPENPEYNSRIKRFFLMYTVTIFSLVGIIVSLVLMISTIQSPRVRVPGVVDKDILEAIPLIQAQRLQLVFETRFNEDVPRGQVIAQFPSQGLSVRINRRVTLVVSLGRDVYYAPELSGMSRQSALDLLIEQKIPYQIVTVPTGENPVDTVIAQNYMAGVEIPRSKNMVLTITEDVQDGQYIVENFVRQSLEFAITRLISQGITPIISNSNIYQSIEDGTVLVQSVIPSSPLAKGSSIALTTGTYARDQGERSKLRWHYIRYRFPNMPQAPQRISTNEDGTINVTADETPPARSYRIEITDELGRKTVLYERTGGEGTVLIKAFKTFGRSELVIFADGTPIDTLQYQ